MRCRIEILAGIDPDALDEWNVRTMRMPGDGDLLESRTLDGRTQELVYRPIPRR
ncbi:hypothetical protein [Dactylosporangium sp. NPDC000521]|uniref:hypothetical protein n=1 Tax=Dactylosporangium sp. NPDC000521 TaxID=3363975 RepID=UPI0036CF3190